MRSSDRSDQLAQQQIKEGPARVAWWKEEVKFEIERLKAILREAAVTEEERAIAQSQIANYHEMTAMAERSAAEWLRQIDLLAA